MGQPQLAQAPQSVNGANRGPVAAPSGAASALRGQSYQQQSSALKPKNTTIMQDIALGQDPNERERAILENDEDAASAWVQAAAWAVAISTTYSHTRKDSGASMYGGRADALRHFLWNAYMAFIVGETKAKQMADAHETEMEPSDSNMAVDREMDLRNNAAGRRLGTFTRGEGMLTRAFALSLMAAAAVSYLNDGSLTVLDKRDDRAWKLVPSNTEGID